MGPGPAVTIADVEAAAERIEGRVHRTPVMRGRSLDEASGAEVFLKCENLQRAGSFKIRGATNAIASLSDEERARGVVTHSSGNHAQALALAAAGFGVPATIVMPRSAPPVKRAATEGYGATVVTCDDDLLSRETTAASVLEETGGVLIHPYDDPRIVAGQGTAALELFDEVGDLDVLMTPVGGGGLASGSAIVCGAREPEVRFVACEPRGADDAARGLAAGRRVERHVPDTIADGLLTTLGAWNFRILKGHGAEVTTVSEVAIVDAMRFVWERCKIIIEPSSAVPVAALLGGALGDDPGRVGIILSGGNVSLDAQFGPMRAAAEARDAGRVASNV